VPWIIWLDQYQAKLHVLDEGPVVISTTTVVGGAILQRGQNVTFELSFSAKGPFADNLRVA
jgi:cold shock CspA family protein